MGKERSRIRAIAHRLAKTRSGGGSRVDRRVVHETRPVPANLLVTIDQTARGPRASLSESCHCGVCGRDKAYLHSCLGCFREMKERLEQEMANRDAKWRAFIEDDWRNFKNHLERQPPQCRMELFDYGEGYRKPFVYGTYGPPSLLKKIDHDPPRNRSVTTSIIGPNVKGANDIPPPAPKNIAKTSSVTTHTTTSAKNSFKPPVKRLTNSNQSAKPVSPAKSTKPSAQAELTKLGDKVERQNRPNRAKSSKPNKPAATTEDGEKEPEAQAPIGETSPTPNNAGEVVPMETSTTPSSATTTPETSTTELTVAGLVISSESENDMMNDGQN